MKYLLVLLCIVSCACGIPGAALKRSGSITAERITAVAGRVQKSYVPDKRTDLFNYEISGSGHPLVKIETTLPEAAASFISQLKEAGIGADVAAGFLPSPALAGKTYGVVSLSVSNNRKDPGNASELVTQMILGTPVRILKKQGGYYLVRSPDRYISWVDDAALQQMDSLQFSAWQKADKLVYTSDYGYATMQPDISSMRVSDLVKGSILQVTGRVNDFYRVLFPDNRPAYIPAKDATDYAGWAARPNPAAEQVLAAAKTLMGIPYLWGGTSIKGVDCSGFTKVSYFLNGIILARDASQQALTGAPVDIYEHDSVSVDQCLKNLQPGDLLFFTNTIAKISSPPVTHTAIYMGGGEFIQAAGMVRISSLMPSSPAYDDYRRRTLVSARRILGAIGSGQITRIDQHPYYRSKYE